jgi:hypothetical protein
MSGDGNLLPVKEAMLTLSLPERGIGPLARTLEGEFNLPAR